MRRTLRRGTPWLGLGLLFLLAGSGLVLDELVPSLLPAKTGAALREMVLATIFGLWVVLRGGDDFTGSASRGVRLSVWGAVLLAGLPLTFAAAATRVTSGTELLVFAAIPAGVVFLRSQAQSGLGVEDTSFRLLLPALAGLGGAGLLIHWDVPPRLAGETWLGGMAAMALLTAFALLQIGPEIAAGRLVSAAAWVSLGGAMANLCGILLNPAGFRWVPPGTLGGADFLTECLRLALEGLTLSLSLWLLRALGAVAYSARYLLVLLVALGESFLVARARLSWTIAGGAMLMLGASVVLLRHREGAAEDAGSELDAL